MSEMLPEIHIMKKCDFFKPIIQCQTIPSLAEIANFSTKYFILRKDYTDEGGNYSMISERRRGRVVRAARLWCRKSP